MSGPEKVRARELKAGDQYYVEPGGIGWRTVLSVDATATHDGPVLCVRLESESGLQQFHAPDEWVTARRPE